MRKYFYSVIFFTLLIICIESQSGFFYGTGQWNLNRTIGWHTTIYSSGYRVSMIMILSWLLFAAVGYFILAIKKININIKSFLIHFILTSPLIIGILFPAHLYHFTTAYSDYTNTNYKNIVLLTVFGIGQIIFIISFINNLRVYSRLS